MIIGIGTDIVDVRRIGRSMERYGERFLHRVFTEGERRYADAASHSQRKTQRYAARFAAKEALLKALGGGHSGISWQDMEVIKNESGAPSWQLHGMAEERVAAIMRTHNSSVSLHLSLSDDWPYALAFVVLECI